MPSRTPLPQDSPSHGLPRRHGTLSHTPFVAVTQPTPAPEDDDAEESEVTVYAAGIAEGEDRDEDDEQDDDDQGDEEGEGSLDYTEHHCPIHHQHPWADQPSYYQDPDDYLSDSQDMSDDAGAPLMDHIVAHLFANDIDMDDPAGSDSDVDYAWAEEDASTSESFLVPHPIVSPDTHGAAQSDDADADADTDIAETDSLPEHALVGEPLWVSPPIHSFFGQPGVVPTAWAHPFSFSNPNPTTIGPSNYGLTDFLHHWARQSTVLQAVARGCCPWPARVNALESEQAELIEYDDLEGDQCDFQGIDWEDIGVTRRDARERRLLTYSNYVNIPASDRWTPRLPDAILPRRESFFRFRRMDIRRNIHLSHFQLRNVFASTSHSRIFYPSVGTVQQYNPLTGHSRAIMNLSDAPASQISTLAAGHGVLVAGGFGGEYILRNLDVDEPDNTACHEGVITASASGITNHVAVHQARTSSAPLAAFASNDNCFRVMDITTETWLSRETLDFAPNCTAVSPDGRLRVMVGDSLDVVITAAESRQRSGEPEILQRLSGHRDYGFACDWADDGWTIATAFQDKTVKIWDARRFTDNEGNAVSVCTLRSEMAGARSVRFSPIGSGKRVLIAAEEADFVNIIDAQTFQSKQTVDVFGELGGISFANGGRDLMVLCCDRTRGGILQLERCGEGQEYVYSDEDETCSGDDQPREVPTSDWPRSMFTDEKRVKGISSRGHSGFGARVDLDPF